MQSSTMNREQKHQLLSRLEEGPSIFLKNMQFQAIIGDDAWAREGKLQPVCLTLRAFRDVVTEGDDINKTLSYSKISKDILEAVSNRDSSAGFTSLDEFSAQISVLAQEKHWHVKGLIIEAQLPKAVLQAERGLVYWAAYINDEVSNALQMTKCEKRIEALMVPCIIGVNPHERLEKQMVEINVIYEELPRTDDFDLSEVSPSHWASLSRDIITLVEESAFETVERLVAHVLDQLMGYFYAQRITLSIQKPSALPHVGGAGVEMTRRKSNTLTFELTNS